MRIDIISVVPELLSGPFNSSIIKKAIDKKIIEIYIHNLRDYSTNNYKSYWEDYGVKENDVIRKINGEDINSISDIEKIVTSRKYYDPISIEILTQENKLERFNFR